MLKDFSATITQNKNILMLFTVGIYILSIFAVLSALLLPISIIILIILIIFILKETLPLKYLITWTVIFYLGVLNTSLRLKDVDELLNLAPVNSEITGTILTIPQGRVEGKPKFFFNVERIKFESIDKEFRNEKVLVTMDPYMNNGKSFDDLKLYDSFILKGRLSTPFKAGNPSQFDYGNYLRNYNTYAVFYAKDFERIDKAVTIKQKFMQNINEYRERILAIHAKYLPSPYLEILGGIVFGDDAVSPPKNIKQSFVSSGLLHILAASGMNVAFIYGFFFIIMSWLRIGYRSKVIMGMLTVVLYTLMTGLGASVIRASCMLLFVLAGKLIDRDAHSISLLSFVGLLMLIYNPLYLNDVGFQLSFIVTLGLLVMTPALLNFKSRVLDAIASTVAVPIIAQLWVIPIQIFYFNNISLYSIFANIMSVPILIILSFGGFISSLLSAVKPISDIVCKSFDFILQPLLVLLVNISDFWGKLPHSTLQTTHPSIFQIVIYYIGLLFLSALLYKEFREKYAKKLYVGLAVLLTVWLISLVPLKNSNMEIIAFDVGNADSFLIKSPNNEYLMIDTGKSGYAGGKSQAEIIMLKYFKDRGIKNINSILITHFDNDHCGGAVDLIKGLRVRNVYVNNLNHSSIAAKQIYETVNNKKSNLILAKNNQVVYNKNGLKLTNFLGESSDSDNENSIITLLDYKGFKMLFTGDAGILGIESVIDYLPRNITVLKVPHHGAVGGVNDSLIKYLNPKYSLFSVGENKFGHPANITLSLLRNTEILRTDVNNSVKITVNSKAIKFYTYDMKKRKYIPYIDVK